MTFINNEKSMEVCVLLRKKRIIFSPKETFVCFHFLFVYAEFREIHHLVDNVCTVGGLLPGKTYAFRVKAKNEAGVRADTSKQKLYS